MIAAVTMGPATVDDESSTYYGTTQLERRSRSPSPSSSRPAPQVTAMPSMFPMPRNLAQRFISRSRSTGRRLPSVPSFGHSPPPPAPAAVGMQAGSSSVFGPVGISSEYDAVLSPLHDSRTPSPASSSVYSLSSYYTRPPLPPTDRSTIQSSSLDPGAVMMMSSGGVPMTSAAVARLRYGISSRASRTSGHPLIAPFVMSLDDQPVLQHIRLPSVSNSPTIPRPDVTQVNPQDMNFPRVCASPSHGTPPSLMGQTMGQGNVVVLGPAGVMGPGAPSGPPVLGHRLFA